MKTKQEIIENWLPRYTGLPLEKFGKYILLTNFQNYVDRFAEWQGVEVVGRDRSMPCATDGEITIINFSMGSANAATIMDLLGAVKPKAVLFLGKCEENQQGWRPHFTHRGYPWRRYIERLLSTGSACFAGI